MDILLTGAQGFTGRWFTQAATAAGHRVTPLVSNLTDRAAVAAELAQWNGDSVLHLAALSHVVHDQPEAFYAVNCVATYDLLMALARHPAAQRAPIKVVLASSANIYGNALGHAGLIDESVPASPTNHYANSKLAMELMARNVPDSLQVVIARPFNYTGVGQSERFLIPKMVAHYSARAERLRLGNLEVAREFNDVRDIVNDYLLLLGHAPAGGVYNLCSGQAHRLLDVVALLEHLSGHRLTIEVDPALVRPNEVLQLAGSPARLADLARSAGRSTEPHGLEQTLRWMLQ